CFFFSFKDHFTLSAGFGTPKLANLADTMSNTMRGTPNRPQGRGAIPFTGSPGGSNIPRPVGDAAGSEVAVGSSVSASRQKQSKRDEVGDSLFRTWLFSPWSYPLLYTLSVRKHES